MLKDITLGQFFPGDSFIHRLDPRTKLLMVIVYIVALFMASNWLGYGLVVAFLAVCIKISTIPLKSITRGLKPVLVIVVLVQSGKESGLSGAISGNSDSYMNKSKLGGLDKVLAKATKWIALAWVLLTLSLSLV